VLLFPLVVVLLLLFLLAAKMDGRGAGVRAGGGAFSFLGGAKRVGKRRGGGEDLMVLYLCVLGVQGGEGEKKEEKRREQSMDSDLDLLTRKYTHQLYDEILDEAPHFAPMVYTAMYRLAEKWGDVERCVIRAGPYQTQWEGREWNAHNTSEEGRRVVVKAPTKIEFEKRRKLLEAQTEWGIPNITDTTYGGEKPIHDVENPVRTERNISITEFTELKSPVKITGE